MGFRYPKLAARAAGLCLLACLLLSCAGADKSEEGGSLAEPPPAETDGSEGTEPASAESDGSEGEEGGRAERSGEAGVPAADRADGRRSPIRVTLDGEPMAPVRNSTRWIVREAVSLRPVLRFETDRRSVERTFVVISPCNAAGEVTAETPVTIIDPTRQTLAPDRDIDLRSPAKCLITASRTLNEVPLEAGRSYLLRLQVHSADKEEAVSVLFRTKGGSGNPTMEWLVR